MTCGFSFAQDVEIKCGNQRCSADIKVLDLLNPHQKMEDNYEFGVKG